MIAFLSSISFGALNSLFALIGLIGIWYILKTMKPKPQKIYFPPTDTLLEKKETIINPKSIPWWLLIIRLLFIVMLVLFATLPFIKNSNESLKGGDKNTLILIDNSWASENIWDDIKDRAQWALSQIQEQNGQAIILPLIIEPDQQIYLNPRQEPTIFLNTLSPRPIEANAQSIISMLEKIKASGFEAENIVYVGSDLEIRDGKLETILAPFENRNIFQASLAKYSSFQIISAENRSSQMVVEGIKLKNTLLPTLNLHNEDSIILASTAAFLNDEKKAFNGYEYWQARFEIPAELRNQASYVAIANLSNASATFLLNGQEKILRVRYLSSHHSSPQALLKGSHYLKTALNDQIIWDETTDLSGLSAQKLYDDKINILILDDIILDAAKIKEITQWIDQGGSLIRFAGNLSADNPDPLSPLALRKGKREFGGTISLQGDKKLILGLEQTPFETIDLKESISINTQLLSSPNISGDPYETWGYLDDFSPVITAKNLGDGLLIYFQITSTPEWSNLPLSPLFPEILNKLINLSKTKTSDLAKRSTDINEDERGLLEPKFIVSAKGQLLPAPPQVAALTYNQRDKAPSLQTPPGLYAKGYPYNLYSTNRLPQIRKPWGTATILSKIDHEKSMLLTPYLLIIIALLFLLDTIGTAYDKGRIRLMKRQKTHNFIACFFIMGLTCLILTHGSQAQEENLNFEKFAEALKSDQLAYIEGPDSGVNRIAKAGITGLSNILAERTSFEPAAPVAIDLNQSDLSLYPFIYWPITNDTPIPNSSAIRRLKSYLDRGGLLVLDSRDQNERALSASAQNLPLRTQLIKEILYALSIPPLRAVSQDHVVSRSYYLLEQFPGRMNGGDLFITANATTAVSSQSAEATEEEHSNIYSGDGISPVLVTSNDFAGAWAMVQNEPILPVFPGGNEQREYAFRTGVNIAMYALTGNYKIDQVHTKAILERLMNN